MGDSYTLFVTSISITLCRNQFAHMCAYVYFDSYTTSPAKGAGASQVRKLQYLKDKSWLTLYRNWNVKIIYDLPSLYASYEMKGPVTVIIQT